MTIEEAGQLARQLAQIDPEPNRVVGLNIDTFHHPYLRFEEHFLLPSVNLYGMEFDQAQTLLDILKRFVPGFIQDCHVLPEARPVKENNYLHLVRAYRQEQRQYIYMIKVLGQYMGGAQSDEIVQAAVSGVSATVQTDRIYFHARLIPVEQIEYQDGWIVDFKPVRLRDALLDGITSAQGFHIAAREMRVVDMFDEIDYSQANEELTRMFSVGVEWKAGRVFRPFMVDYHTLTMNLVYPERPLVEGFLPHFHRGFEALLRDLDLENLDPITRDFWADYYQAFQYERALSRASNPHWRLLQYPDENWLARSGQNVS